MAARVLPLIFLLTVLPFAGRAQYCVMSRIFEPGHGDVAPFSWLQARCMGKQELYQVALHEAGQVIGIPPLDRPAIDGRRFTILADVGVS